jgi:hypothetical protein
MRLRRYPFMAAAVAVLGLLAPGLATATPTVKGPPAAPHSHQVPGLLRSLSCASRSLCFAITLAHQNQKFGVIRLTHKGASSHTTLLHGSTPTDLSCPSAAGCALLAQRSVSPYAPVDIPVSSHGSFGKPMSLGNAADVNLQNIACKPVRTHCTAVGAANQTVYVVTVNGSTKTEHDLTLPLRVAGAGIKGLACPSATECYAIGAVSIKQKEHGLIVPIHNGVPGSPVYVASASYDGMVAIGCSSATTCDLLGASEFHVFVYAVHSAKVTRTSKLPLGLSLDGIACQSAHLCDAVGTKKGKGAVLPIRNGKPGKVQVSGVTEDYSAGGGDGEGPVAGYHGGIEIIGFGTTNYHSLISSS